MYDDFIFPRKLIEQNEIFYNQDAKFIKIDKKVSVLSAFPLMLLDYYGISTLKDKIEIEIERISDRLREEGL